MTQDCKPRIWIWFLIALCSSGCGIVFGTYTPCNYAPWTSSADFVPGTGAAISSFAATSSTIYAAGYDDIPGPQTHWRVRKSTDQGAAWTVVDDYYPGFISRAFGIAIAPNGSVFVAGNSGSTWKVRRSTDGGNNWTQVDSFILPGGTSSQANSVVVDAAGNIFVGGQSYDAGSTRSSARR